MMEIIIEVRHCFITGNGVVLLQLSFLLYSFNGRIKKEYTYLCISYCL